MDVKKRLLKEKLFREIEEHRKETAEWNRKRKLKDENKDLRQIFGGSNITDADLKDLEHLQQLTSLEFNSPKITDEGLKEVAKLKNLKNLTLQGTQVTKAGVYELMEALPNCVMIGDDATVTMTRMSLAGKQEVRAALAYLYIHMTSIDGDGVTTEESRLMEKLYGNRIRSLEGTGNPNEIQITRKEKQFGPYSRDQAKDYYAAGQLLPTDWGWYEGIGEWKPLHIVMREEPAAITNREIREIFTSTMELYSARKGAVGLQGEKAQFVEQDTTPDGIGYQGLKIRF